MPLPHQHLPGLAGDLGRVGLTRRERGEFSDRGHQRGWKMMVVFFSTPSSIKVRRSPAAGPAGLSITVSEAFPAQGRAGLPLGCNDSGPLFPLRLGLGAMARFMLSGSSTSLSSPGDLHTPIHRGGVRIWRMPPSTPRFGQALHRGKAPTTSPGRLCYLVDGSVDVFDHKNGPTGIDDRSRYRGDVELTSSRVMMPGIGWAWRRCASNPP